MSGHDEFDLSIYDDEYLYGDSGPRSPTSLTAPQAAQHTSTQPQEADSTPPSSAIDEPTNPAESYAAYAAAIDQQQQQQQLHLNSPTHASNAAPQKRPYPDSDGEMDARPTKVPATEANVGQTGEAASGYGGSETIASPSMADSSNDPQQQSDEQATNGGQAEAPALDFDMSHIQQYRDPNATSALIIEDLSWWTSDRDVIDVVTMVTKDQNCVKDITFNEHKVNGKSRGSVYVQFTTPDMAAAAKVGFENIEIDQRMPVVRFTDPTFNPFRVLPKDGQNRNMQQQQPHHQGGGFRPHMQQNFQGGGGGYRPPFNNNMNNQQQMGGYGGPARPPPGGQYHQRPPQGMGGYNNPPPGGPYGGGPGGPGMGMPMGGQFHQRPPPHQGFPNRPPHLPPPPSQLPPPPGQGGYYGRPPHPQQQQPGGFGGMNGGPGDRRGSGVGQY